MSAETDTSLVPESEVSQDSICETLAAWADTTKPCWQHILEIEMETDSNLKSDVYLIPMAEIPATSGTEMTEGVLGEAEGKELTVEALSGEVTHLTVLAPHTVAHVKQMLEACLGIPAVLQKIILDSVELPDEAVVAGGSVTLLKSDPPIITSEDFLRSMAEVHGWERKDVFRRWHSFDTYRQFPATKMQTLQWAMGHKGMRNVPLTAENVLGCFDVWLGLNHKEGTHPDSFRAHVNEVVAFLQHCCYSPSLLVAYDVP